MAPTYSYFQEIAVKLNLCTTCVTTFLRYTDTSPTDKSSKDSSPTDGLPTGHFAHRTFRWQDSLPTRHFADRTVRRQDSWGLELGHVPLSSYSWRKTMLGQWLANIKTTLIRQRVYCERKNIFFTTFSVDVEEKVTARWSFNVASLNFFTSSRMWERTTHPLYWSWPG